MAILGITISIMLRDWQFPNRPFGMQDSSFFMWKNFLIWSRLCLVSMGVGVFVVCFTNQSWCKHVDMFFSYGKIYLVKNVFINWQSFPMTTKFYFWHFIWHSSLIVILLQFIVFDIISLEICKCNRQLLNCIIVWWV